MPLPPVRYWEAPPEYDLLQDFTEGELPDDFDFAQMLQDPTESYYGTGPQAGVTWAEYMTDYFGYEPTPDHVKSAIWNVMDRARYSPGDAQLAYDSVLYLDPATGSNINNVAGEPGGSMLEQGSLATMEKMGIRPSHLYGDGTFYTRDMRAGRNQISKWELDPVSGQYVESVVWEGRQGDIGASNLAMQQIGAQLGLTPEQLDAWSRYGLLAVYDYPEGNRPEMEGIVDPAQPEGSGWGNWGGADGQGSPAGDMGAGGQAPDAGGGSSWGNWGGSDGQGSPAGNLGDGSQGSSPGLGEPAGYIDTEWGPKPYYLPGQSGGSGQVPGSLNANPGQERMPGSLPAQPQQVPGSLPAQPGMDPQESYGYGSYFSSFPGRQRLAYNRDPSFGY